MNILVVGLGSMGKRRARLAQSLGHTLFGVDSDKGRRKEAQGLSIETFDSLNQALEHKETYDAAFVCTAPLSHMEVTKELLMADLPVFSELNLVDDGYDVLIELAKERQKTLFLSSTMLYRAEIGHIKKRVDSFAKPMRYIYHIGQYLPDWHPWESYKNFFVGNARTGGVREIFGIELPWLCTVFGKAKAEYVCGQSISDLELPYPDSVMVNLKHENGTVGVLCADVVSPKAVRNFELFGDGIHVFWEGNPKSLYEYDINTKEKVSVDTYKSFEQDSRYSDNIVENAYLDEMICFFETLKGNAQPLWDFEKDRKIIHLMDDIEKAAKVQ